jgi:hypothetical protein
MPGAAACAAAETSRVIAIVASQSRRLIEVFVEGFIEVSFVIVIVFMIVFMAAP